VSLASNAFDALGGGNGDVDAATTRWLAEYWDPELSVLDWWLLLAESGLTVPTWPRDWYGYDLPRDIGNRVHRAIARFGALGPPVGQALLLVGPTILRHGTDEQKGRYLPSIVSGQAGWCQLFSEPAAGSDLAGLQTRADPVAGGFVVNGQKVWTTNGATSDMGMLLARTDPDAPKHRGLSWMIVNMDQPGIEVRPLREMTGEDLFSEVFLTDVFVEVDAVVGGLGNGWGVANTTLGYERTNYGAGGSKSSLAVPGSRAGDLDKRAGRYVRTRSDKSRTVDLAVQTPVRSRWSRFDQELLDRAKEIGRLGDPDVREDFARLYTFQQLAGYLGLRHKALRAVGQELPGVANMGKLWGSRTARHRRDLALNVLGLAGTLHGYVDEAASDPFAEEATSRALFSPATSIYGGTDEVQRNILGEPDPFRGEPFRSIPRNV